MVWTVVRNETHVYDNVKEQRFKHLVTKELPGRESALTIRGQILSLIVFKDCEDHLIVTNLNTNKHDGTASKNSRVLMLF